MQIPTGRGQKAVYMKSGGGGGFAEREVVGQVKNGSRKSKFLKNAGIAARPQS